MILRQGHPGFVFSLINKDEQILMLKSLTEIYHQLDFLNVRV